MTLTPFNFMPAKETAFVNYTIIFYGLEHMR